MEKAVEPYKDGDIIGNLLDEADERPYHRYFTTVKRDARYFYTIQVTRMTVKTKKEGGEKK